ncbi:unnamed protein product [Rotaria sp. Silwood1]|nr:unnamed protein product [Rotaria sp. Silwood1]CAF1360988.1 unnamed protein product [Rotaria sp. Silwood1]CAF4602294.1 unnamed protein product [Rotaria sp. Silwood1]
MISSRAILIFISLVLALITVISTAPMHNDKLYVEVLDDKSTHVAITTNESLVYDDDKDTSNASKKQCIKSTMTDWKEETTSMSKIVATDVLAVNITEISANNDDIIKMVDRILADTEAKLSAIATTEKSNQDDDYE